MPLKNKQALLQAGSGVLVQLKNLAQALSPEQYSRPLDLLTGNTIGKHYRHIIEFYQCMLNAGECINYDKRQRDAVLEVNNSTAARALHEIINRIAHIETLERTYTYEADFSADNPAPVSVSTTIGRELAYNIEHAVHHMAIIQMVVKHYFPDITLEADFGVAASTRRHQQEICVQ